MTSAPHVYVFSLEVMEGRHFLCVMCFVHAARTVGEGATRRGGGVGQIEGQRKGETAYGEKIVTTCYDSAMSRLDSLIGNCHFFCIFSNRYT